MPPGPKPATTLRRASSALSKVSTPSTVTASTTAPDNTKTSSPRTGKSSKPNRIIRFKLPKDVLSRFPHEQIARKASQIKSSPLSTSTVITPDEPAPSATVRSETDSTPTLNEGKDTASPVKGPQAEAPSSPKTGAKRELGAGVDSDDKDKTKTNPRKKPRPDPTRPDGRTAAAKAAKGALGNTAGPTHKLGPKANQGAINAGLRALDRTGKPCRKWEKTGFRVKSFTGRVWEIPSWRAPTAKAFGSESEQITSSSQSKENSSSNIGSDKSPAANPSLLASSPAPGIAISA